jgi:hypothetical protein
VPPQVNRASDEATQRVASSWNTRGPIEGSRVNKARDDATQRVASSWNTWGPIEGSQHPQASYLSPGQEVSFTFLCVGWYLAIQVLPIRITQERHLKLPSLDLIGGGGGASTTVWSYGEALTLDACHLQMVTQAPLRS